MSFRVAFYKSQRPGLQGLYSAAVKWWTRSSYSHCEFVFSDGVAASASFIDGGVRFKNIEFDNDHWDFLDIPDRYEAAAREFINNNLNTKYDLLGNFGFIIGPLGDDRSRLFCSEVIAAGLGMSRPDLFYPGILYDALSFAFPPEL